MSIIDQSKHPDLQTVMRKELEFIVVSGNGHWILEPNPNLREPTRHACGAVYISWSGCVRWPPGHAGLMARLTCKTCRELMVVAMLIVDDTPDDV